jgi:hypothetical protein
MFIRLNAGAPLKDYDFLWARRDTPLVSATRTLVCGHPRLSAALGGIDLRYRPDLANWTAIVAGLSTWNSGNMTTSFIRLSSEELGLEREVHEDRITAGVDAFCALLEAANQAYPVLAKQQKQLKKVGKIAAFFLHEWMEQEDRSAVHAKWVGIIGRLRGNNEVSKAMSAALSTTGAQNLTSTKISQTIRQVDEYLASGVVDLPSVTSDDESDDED